MDSLGSTWSLIKSYSKPTTIGMLNQAMFFGEAMKTVLGKVQQQEDPGLQDAVDTMADFVDIQTKTFKDLGYVLAGLDLSLLLAKREEALKGAKLSAEDKNLLRFAPPTDSEQRLFAGKLHTFEEMRAKRDNCRAIARAAYYSDSFKRPGAVQKKQEPPTKRPFRNRTNFGPPARKGREETKAKGFGNRKGGFRKSGGNQEK